MIHRIIEGPNATEVAIWAYNSGICYLGVSPMDLSPEFVNCVRVFSNLEVTEIVDQEKFDAQLTELGDALGGITVRYDVGAFHGVIGRPLVGISPADKAGAIKVLDVDHFVRPPGSKINRSTKIYQVAGSGNSISIGDATRAGSLATPTPASVRAGTTGSGPTSIVDAPTPPEPERRFLQGRFPRSVRIGKRATLQVRIAREPGSDASGPLKEFQIPPEGADILLVLYCPGFNALEKTESHARVRANTDSDWIAFELEARELGVHNLEVNAYGPGGFLGTLLVQVTVADQVDQSSPVDHTAPANIRPPAPGEFTLLIRYDRVAQVYRYNFIEGNLAVSDEIASRPLMGGPELEVASTIDQLNSMARGRSEYDVEETRAFI
jgi:hypothetical protein